MLRILLHQLRHRTYLRCQQVDIRAKLNGEVLQLLLIPELLRTEVGLQQQCLDQGTLPVLPSHKLQQLVHPYDLLDKGLERSPLNIATMGLVYVTIGIRRPQPQVFGSLLDEVIFEAALILQIAFLLTAFNFVERWLRDVQVTFFHQVGDLAIEERQQQRAYVGTVHVCVCHDDDGVVAELLRIVIVLNTCA